MANEDVRINLTSSADTAGIDKMGAAVGGLSGGAAKAAAGLGDASKSAKEMGQGLGKAVEVGGATTALMQNIASASQGGAQGMFAAGRAILSFGQIVKGVLLGAGPVGIAIAALGLLAGAALALKDAFKPAGETVEDFKKRLDGLDKANLKALDATISALSDRLKAAKEDADAVRASLDKIDDAEMAAKLSAVGGSNLTADQKKEQEFLIRDEFKRRRTERERGALEQSAAGSREMRDALAPEFEDARDAYGERLNQLDRIKREVVEINALYRRAGELQQEAGGAMDPRWLESRKLREEAKSRSAALPSKDEAEKMDAELASARNRFQGADGKGGIAADYQRSVQEADKAAKALERFNSTLAKVGEWEKAQARIENGGIDPRDREAGARKSPGRARMVGPDGQVREYDVQSAPTLNQQLGAQADAARVGPLASPLNTIIPGGGALPGATDSRITRDGGKLGDQAKQINEAMQQAGEKAAEPVDLQPAVDGATAVKEGNEALKAALDSATTAQAEALTAAAQASAEAASTLGTHAAAISSIKAELAAIKSRMAAARVKA